MKNVKSNKAFEESPLNQDDRITRPYVASTNNIQVTVWPEFIDSKTSVIGDIFIWAYHVRIDNKSPDSVKLVSRYWRIIDEQGVTQEISGEGVIGEQPIIESGKSFQYSSGVHLRHPSGIMTGTYNVIKLGLETEKQSFDIKIPSFSLDVPTIKNVLN